MSLSLFKSGREARNFGCKDSTVFKSKSWKHCKKIRCKLEKYKKKTTNKSSLTNKLYFVKRTKLIQ